MDAMVDGSALLAHVRVGIGAMERRDLELIEEAERRRVGDSCNLDEALRTRQPNEHRWDYLLSVPEAGQLVGLEPHSAGDSEVQVVIQKCKNARAALQQELKPGLRISRWYWVTRGRVSFSRMDRATRQLSQNGIEFVGRRLAALL